MNRLFVKGICLFFALAGVATAQWTTQTVELKAGWNAVCLTVQPVPATCESVFSYVSVERVQQWSRTKGGAEFISDVNEELARPSDWLIWRPASSGFPSSLNSLNMLLAGHAYLVHVSEATLLEIKGRAVLVEPEWIPNEMNLLGLPVGGAVSFGAFFAYTDDIGVDSSDGGVIYEVRQNGTEQEVFRPTTARVTPGKAYWIKAGQELDYQGPLNISLRDGNSYMDFGAATGPRTLQIQNITSEERQVTLSLSAGGNPPEEDGVDLFPLAQGMIPLSYRQFNQQTLRMDYLPMPDTLTTNIAAHSTFELTLFPRANEMQSADVGAVWESILSVSDSAGLVKQTIGLSSQQEQLALNDPAGLWVGNVVVDAVSRAPSQAGGTNVWNTVEPVAVSRAYSFRVLLHVSSDGTTRLLQRAFPAWMAASETDAEPETYVFTDAAYASQFKNDFPAVEMARISSAAFPLMPPVLLNGSFGAAGTVNGIVDLAFDDATNPFRHTFHPAHDNKEYRNGTASSLGEGEESFDVSRHLTFRFESADPLGANPQWGISEAGGFFEESVEGLNKTIFVKGVFRLEKVSTCGVLSYLNQ
ncbi:hypothetical protein P4C99_02695 [Pontiellaceae bacterium B1224]|nr:hypothetical protein [Pontiellaceae bacterium B1224]